MAFCKFCGKELAEGEVCSCQNSEEFSQNKMVNLHKEAGMQEDLSNRSPQINQANGNPQMNAPYGQPQRGPMNGNPQMNSSYGQPQRGPMNGNPQVNSPYGQPQRGPMNGNPQMNSSYGQPQRGPMNGNPQVNSPYGQPQRGPMNGNPQMNAPYGQPYYRQPNPQVAQAKQAAGGFLKKALESITKPVTNAVNCVKDSSNFGLVAILVNLALLFVGLIFVCIYIKGKLGIFGGAIPYAKIILGSLILNAAGYFGYAGAYVLTTNVFFRENLSFKNSMNIISSKAVWDVIVTVVAVIFMILNTKAGIVVWIAGMLFTLIVMFYSYSENVKLSPDKKAYAMFMSVIFVFVVTSILSFIVFGSSLNSIIETIQSYIY